MSDDGKAALAHALSLDGFIAGPGDDMGWVFDVDGGSGQTADEVVRSTGALLVGRRTQDVEDRDQPGFYGGSFRGPFFVLRHDPPAQPPVVKGVTGQFLDTGIEEAVARAKDAAGGLDVVILGANVARQCIEAGLVDEIIVHIAPFLLGAGVRFFERRDGAPIRLRTLSSRREGETMVLRYAVDGPTRPTTGQRA
ncbi:dihydrofolate reductase family protein [Actinocatenispora sera]|uniref:dihydrofolate reductase family protein n=1 Tax=Actinocatenispora sera TaxID=390989 RepID=UPI0004C3246D|nr:dihydrofolate reductase family protein [Actinocatenispora sera]